MRIVVNGQQAFGKAVLEALLDRGEEVIAVYGPEVKEGRRPDPVIDAARERNLPIYSPKSFKDEAVWDEFRALKPDLSVMAYVTKLVPQTFIDIPTKGTIQYHPSLLPLHRGPSSINWPIIMGETKTGLTIFWPDEGLDTGPILLQKEVAIEPDDTLGTVYFNKLFPLGVEAMLESVDLVRDGKAPSIVQDDSKATYESWCRAENVELDWSKPAAEVYNMIRGADPQPGAWTRIDGTPVQLYDARKLGGSGAPGTITAINEDGITFAAADGLICAGRVRPEGGDKVKGAEFASSAGIAVGKKTG